MNSTLFVCTANIFRSRFAEEVYNAIAREKGIYTSAFSAGLRVGDFKYRKIYPPALKQLKKFQIQPLRSEEKSIHINDINLKDFDRIICMDKLEHEPMIKENPRLKTYNFEYWEIVDMPKVDSSISLPACYRKVESLLLDIQSE